MSWGRRLDSNWTPNPIRIGNGKPDYQIRIEHVLPTPLPAGVKQVWQVIKCMVFTLDLECKAKFETRYLLDIVDINGRTAVSDRLMLRKRDEYCLVWELCEHTIGFDDQRSNYEEYSSELIVENLANRLIRTMSGPTATFKTNYVYYKGDCCPELIAFLTFGWGLSPGEWLNVEGVGQYPPPPAAPPNNSGESNSDGGKVPPDTPGDSEGEH